MALQVARRFQRSNLQILLRILEVAICRREVVQAQCRYSTIFGLRGRTQPREPRAPSVRDHRLPRHLLWSSAPGHLYFYNFLISWGVLDEMILTCFVRERKPADVLAVMKPLETYMTSEIADELGWSRRSAYNVLSRLHENGEIRKKKPEARRVIWIRPE